MPFPSLTVVIPTYNRREVLGIALEGYIRQATPRSIAEILVIDDGSTDDTEAAVRTLSQRAPFPIRYMQQCNQGPAAARNFGIRNASSDLILFTDSDVIPREDLVMQHLRSHRRNPQLSVVVQGYLAWNPATNPTPFMRWYGRRRLFNFGEIEHKNEVDYRFFYSCNVSLKTRFLRSSDGFDEEFRTAAYEDTELAYRLSQRGMRLIYNSRAIGHHHQSFTFEDACHKARSNAGAMQVFFRKQAGTVALREIQMKQSRSSYRLATRVAKQAIDVMAPLRRFLNSSIPMPGFVYRLFFWSATRDVIQAASAIKAALSTAPLPSLPVAKQSVTSREARAQTLPSEVCKAR
jgi:glycosyltransferase involved in cell wall biosynthesis